MFQGLLKRAERSIEPVVAKYMERAMVAVPLLVGRGFATAALTVKLVELLRLGLAYGAMAALFGVIGLVTMAIVNVGAQRAAEARRPRMRRRRHRLSSHRKLLSRRRRFAPAGHECLLALRQLGGVRHLVVRGIGKNPAVDPVSGPRRLHHLALCRGLGQRGRTNRRNPVRWCGRRSG